MLKQSDVVSGSAYIHMFSTAQPVCLLVGAFNPFTFKVLIDMYDPITIFLTVWVNFLQVFPSVVFPAQRSSFSICCKTGLVVLNSLNFCLSGNLLISPSNLKESHAGQSILGCRFFPFIILNISCHSLLACRVSVEKSADNLMGVPLHVICHFSLVAFNIFP